MIALMEILIHPSGLIHYQQFNCINLEPVCIVEQLTCVELCQNIEH